MATNSRAARVADQIQRDLAVLLQREMKDPRLGIVTVSAVDVSTDLQNAKVFVTFLGKEDAEEIAAGVEVLSNAAGFLRSQLAKSIRMRSVPSLKFFYDKSISEGQKMSSLIEQAISADEANHSDS
ncbi:30S ribosome-binding factor RbfA [Kangiella sp. HZ709]|uniref:30S ribosome-binding factor RbfA n=1 Tax=Kangiella sp. HZ709 TaxID=2666328 RepID=UPI0012AF94C0|nr:30S ribosome-binding factor RbfA [Kangiella sp. HZ709]MRX27739.1 30S ribosome-binding factor RbfA [Kangiella sp. HZ709]